jgi:type II secretory pathway component PulF
MTAFIAKIRNVFSDLVLETELFFDKIFHGKKKEAVASSAAKQPTIKTPFIVKKENTGKKEKLPLGVKMLKMTSGERLFFYDQLSTLVGSGVTLIDSMSLVMTQTKNRGLKALYKEMIHDINTGMSMADSMYRFPHIFPVMQSALMEAAEKSGNLKTVLAELVEEMETSQDFRRKITGAMFYPVLLIIMAFALVTGMMLFVVPKISEMYEQADYGLPPLTQAVISISNYVAANWQILFLYIFGTIFVFLFLFSKVKYGRLFWENVISITPVAGKISKQKNLMTICANMAMLMKSGVLISEAFAITEKTMGNLHYRRALADIRQGVIMGKEVSEMMGFEDIKTGKFRKNRLFPIEMAQLIHIGESTGKIAAMMEKLKSNYHKNIEYTLRNISAIIEPLMIFLVAILVGTILLAVMLPFFNIGNVIR